MFGDSNPRDANAVQNQAQSEIGTKNQLVGTGANCLPVCCYQGTVSDIKWARTWTSIWSSLDLELSYMMLYDCRFVWLN